MLEGHRITGEVIEVEHVGKQAKGDHPEGEDHLEGALGEAEELAPAVSLQRQDQHREDHHHTQVAGGGDEYPEQRHHQPLLPVGKQEHPQHQRHKGRLGITGDKVGGEGGEGQQPDAETCGVITQLELAQHQQHQRQADEGRQVGDNDEADQALDIEQVGDGAGDHRIERHEGPVGRIALAQPARVEVVAVFDDALEPDAVELAIGLQRPDTGSAIELDTEIAHAIEGHAAQHEGGNDHQPVTAADAQ